MKSKLVSVIITCYNHSNFLQKCINSVIEQSYGPIEIIIVDDGSTDKTKEVATSFQDVKYVYQNNKGLPAARNTGIINSTGFYLVFLDADDWLLPEGIAINLKHFIEDKMIGMVSGNYMRYYEKRGELKIRDRIISKDVYADLLLYNHLRMHGAVMFQRFVFDQFQYDTSLRSAEDWDITLNISRHYPVVQHNEPIAVYRKYGTSMSSNYMVMLENGLTVLKKQKKHVHTAIEKNNLRKGTSLLKQKFTKKIFQQVLSRTKATKLELFTLLKYNQLLFLKYVVKAMAFKF